MWPLGHLSFRSQGISLSFGKHLPPALRVLHSWSSCCRDKRSANPTHIPWAHNRSVLARFQRPPTAILCLTWLPKTALPTGTGRWEANAPRSGLLQQRQLCTGGKTASLPWPVGAIAEVLATGFLVREVSGMVSCTFSLLEKSA